MNEKRTGQRNTQRQARDEMALSGRSSSDQAPQQEQQSPHKPSKIEPREWRGSGVCGDRHTD